MFDEENNKEPDGVENGYENGVENGVGNGVELNWIFNWNGIISSCNMKLYNFQVDG